MTERTAWQTHDKEGGPREPDPQDRPATSATTPGTCWYSHQERRPAFGGCPRVCNGPVVYTERAADGTQLVYCDAHAYWRRRTSRLPLVRHMRPDEQAEPASVATPQRATDRRLGSSA
jgi:hypothetical protein